MLAVWWPGLLAFFIMKPKSTWKWVAAIALLGWHTLPAAEAGKRPNILFIFTDDQSYKTVGCYPESWPWVKTPNIDALAKTGIRFRGAYLGSWCMPSRATILTGRLPHGVESMSMAGVYPGSTYDPAQCPFVPAEMRKQGYHTAHIGKWHTGDDAGWGRDWDHQRVWNRPKHQDNAGAYYTKQIVATDGVEEEVEGYPADNYTNWAVDYIKGTKRDASKPWYLWLCYGSVHGPSTPAKRHKGRYADAEVPLPADIFPPREGKPDYLNRTQSWDRGQDGHPMARKGGEAFGEAGKGKRFDDWVRQVNECVPAIDEGVGKLIETLKATGQYDNTLIIYTADQGFAMGEHGFRTKLAPYDANYRSPMIVAMPGRVAEGRVTDASVSGADLTATCLSFAGVKVPWQLHGRDLSAFLARPETGWVHPCLYENMGSEYGSVARQAVLKGEEQARNKDFPRYVAVVHKGWKLIGYLDGKSGEELYDLKSDPEELKNLASAPENAGKLKEMRAVLRSELTRTEAGFEPVLPGK